MKEYMLMAIGGGSGPAKQPNDEERAAAGKAMGAWMQKLQASGQLLSPGAPLRPGGKRIAKGGVVTDLSAIEMKEIVMGYMIIKAQDDAEALQIAQASPMVQFNQVTLDVREVVQMG